MSNSYGAIRYDTIWYDTIPAKEAGHGVASTLSAGSSLVMITVWITEIRGGVSGRVRM